ncbi:hypothetical protein PFISCL1PPCAC_19887, partial [Pristionchus fissidentatus]
TQMSDHVYCFSDQPAEEEVICTSGNEYPLLGRNIVSLLRSRELGQVKRGSEYHRNSRIFYNIICPSTPYRSPFSTPSYIRAFSPDGKYLIAYGLNLKSVDIYGYNGVTAMPGNENDNTLERLLSRLHSVDVGMAGAYQIFIETTLFTSDSSHVVVVTNSPVMDGSSRLDELYVNNETPATTNAPLERYRIHAISLKTREITGTICHDMDRLQTFPSLQGRILCLLSVHRQCILLYSISLDKGEFIPLKSMGQSMIDDDHMYLPQEVYCNRLAYYLSALKHRLFSFMYKRAKKGNKMEMTSFFSDQAAFRQYRMVRCQLVDMRYVLVRMQKEGDMSSGSFLLILIEWESGEVIDVWTKTDQRLLSAFEHSPWSFSQPFLSVNRSPFSARSIPYHRNVFMAYDLALSKSFSETLPVRMVDEYRRRILSYLPAVYSVHLNESPYLDPTLFSIDEPLAIALSWGRIKVDTPHAHLSLHSLDASHMIQFVISAPSSRQLSVLFHPTDPLVIFFDRYRTDQPLTIYCPYT